MFIWRKRNFLLTQAIWCFEDLSQYLRLDELSDLDGTVRDNALEDTLEGDSEDQSILDESEVAVPNSRQKEMASSDHFERMNPSEIAQLRFNKKSSSFKKSQTESSKVKDVHAPEYVAADQLHDQYQHHCGKEQQEPHQPRNKTPAKKVKAYESVSEPVGQHHYRHQHHDQQEQQEQQLPKIRLQPRKLRHMSLFQNKLINLITDNNTMTNRSSKSNNCQEIRLQPRKLSHMSLFQNKLVNFVTNANTITDRSSKSHINLEIRLQPRKLRPMSLFQNKLINFITNQSSKNNNFQETRLQPRKLRTNWLRLIKTKVPRRRTKIWLLGIC